MPTIDIANDPYRWVVEIRGGGSITVDGLELAAAVEEANLGETPKVGEFAAAVRSVAAIEGDVTDAQVFAAGLKVMEAVEDLGNARGRRPASPSSMGSSPKSTA